MKSSYRKSPVRTAAALLCLVAAAAGFTRLSTSGNGASFEFPRFFVSGNYNIGVGIFNPAATSADVDLTVTRASGVLDRNATVTVPARGQIARSSGQIFGTLTADGSLSVAGTTSGLVVNVQAFANDGSFVDGAEAPTSALNLIFPVVPKAGEGTAEITLLNKTDRGASVELSLWGSGGDLRDRATVSVPAGGTFRKLVTDVFAAGTFSDASHITAASKSINIFNPPQPVSGTSLFDGFSSGPASGANRDIAVLNALALTDTFNSGVLPHFRVGARHASALALANVEPAAVNVTLTAVGNDGVTLATGTVNLRANGGFRGSIAQVFPALASGEREGWILVSASGRVAASLVHGRTDTSALSALPMQKTSQLRFVFPQAVQNAGMQTEIVLANSGSSASNADIFVVTSAGVTLASKRVSVGPSRRVTGRLDQLIPEMAALGLSGGYVFVSATQPLFAAASLWSGTDTVASFSPAPVPSSFSPPVQTSFAVSGKVTLNGRPAPGFRVVLSGPVGQLATTAADGSYIFTGLPAGKYSMTIDQYGFQFAPAQVSFEITTSSVVQDFQGFTGAGEILVQPGSIPANGPDVTVVIFGTGFDSSSEAFSGDVRLKTTFVDSTQLQVVIPAFLTASPARFEITVVTSGSTSKPFSIVAFVARPTLTSVTAGGEIVEGAPGGTLTITGSGFLAGAVVRINGRDDGIRVNVVSDTQILALVPASYFERGGIFPVTIENPYPANVESNVQLLAIFHPTPAIDYITPANVPARLEQSAGPLTIDIFGFGFRRGAVVLANKQRMPTVYCENDPICLTNHVIARLPAETLRKSGFVEISVENPAPSLAASDVAFLRVDGLQPTITSVLPGAATVLNLARDKDTFVMPVVVEGTNFGSQTEVRIYQVVDTTPPPPLPDFSDGDVVVLGSTQLYRDKFEVSYPGSIGKWRVEVANPQPGGGSSEPWEFEITAGTFVANPFLLDLNPRIVPAAGPAFTLTVNGTNFKNGAQLNFYSTPLVTTVLSPTQVRGTVPASLIRSAGTIPITLTNPDNGGTSNRLFLEVR